MSQFRRIITDEELGTEHTVVWGADRFSGAYYMVVFNHRHDIVASMDSRFDGIDEAGLIECVSAYGVNPLDVAQTLQRGL